jgi:signal transduction histidine kinase
LLKYLHLLLFIFIGEVCIAQDAIVLSDSNKTYSHENSFNYYVDKAKAYSAGDINKPEFVSEFKPATGGDFNFGLTSAAVWHKFTLINEAGTQWLIKAGNPTAEDITLYIPRTSGGCDSMKVNFMQSMDSRPWKSNNYFLTLPFPDGKKQEFFIRYTSNHSLMVKPQIATVSSFFVSNHYADVWAGIYLGLILVMALYNFFIFISLKDQSYLYYVLYILCIGLIVSMQNAYPFDLFWPNLPELNSYIDLLTCGAGVFGILFTMHFLHTKKVAPKTHSGLYVVMILFVVAAILVLAKYTLAAAIAVEVVGGISALFVFFTVIYIYRQGYKAARFYLLAWTSLLLGIIFFILNDLGITDTDVMNINPLQMGSAIESLLLSFALADRFNLIKKEKEALVLEQNVILEKRVKERTSELSTALNNLKETQEQLLLHEKLASLGKMTSGIAHEIQNPMNFVNNFSDLSKDLIVEIRDAATSEERKEILDELESNLEKINHHGRRADSIVKNMLMHSRAEGKEKDLVDINILCEEAINFSYSGIKAKFKIYHCSIIKEFASGIPKLQLIGQEISRVILNLLNNAFYAVKDKPDAMVKISTSFENGECKIKIRDNGVGIPEEVRQKIFEPFFTTKPTGEGTGLGLSICYDIIKNHDGELHVESKENEYTEFTIIFKI